MRHRGFMLLEIVVAVGLLVLGMALVGAQMQGSLERTHATDLLARAVFLAESRLAEIDTGLVIPKLNEPVEEDFGRLFPRWASRVSIAPLVDRDAPAATAEPDPKNLGLLFVELQILYDPRRDIEEEFDFDEAEVVASYRTLRAPPQRNLVEYFDIPLGDDENPLPDPPDSDCPCDPYNLDPTQIAQCDIEEIVECITWLTEQAGVDVQDVLPFLPPGVRGPVEAQIDNGVPNEETESSSGEAPKRVNDDR